MISISNVVSFKFKDHCLIHQLKLALHGMITLWSQRGVKLICFRWKSMPEPELHNTKFWLYISELLFWKLRKVFSFFAKIYLIIEITKKKNVVFLVWKGVKSYNFSTVSEARNVTTIQNKQFSKIKHNLYLISQSHSITWNYVYGPFKQIFTSK